MTKEEWKEWYKVFKDSYTEYYFANQEYSNGKNKTIRKEAEEKMEIVKWRIKNILQDNEEIYELIEFPDEFFTYQWFWEDFQKLLGKIKEKTLE